MATWTRRQVLAQMGLAAAAVHTLDPHELCCTVAAHAQTADKDLFDLKKVGDGVYAAIAHQRYKTNCNGTVIVTDDGVIVVDSHSKPSASKALYAQLQEISKKPVIKVINTHFHWDHWQGNESYASTNPKVEIIASQNTKENMTKPDAGVGGVPFIEKQIAALPAELEKLKADIQKESDPAKKKNLESNLQQAESFLQELKSMKPAPPTRGIATTTTLKEGGREIQLHVLGRAHTNGDLFIYLPKEKVVATGDALIDWMPFMNDGYPEEWITTLTALDKLDFTSIVPGHGDVRPKSHLAFFRGYFVDLIDAVKKAAADKATLAEMQTKVGDQLASKYEAGMSKYPVGRYRDRVGQNVEMIYKKVVQKA
ncbi:MAG TPA: MBL fold metallo-hydrolase [Methylomirabilota bacterium]|nr:MBL fold metallo-hydrolase [Methylomirabilota bacterium]